MVVPGDNRIIEQLTKQLYKLINVLRVQDITNLPCVERELMLLKVPPRFELGIKFAILCLTTWPCLLNNYNKKFYLLHIG